MGAKGLVGVFRGGKGDFDYGMCADLSFPLFVCLLQDIVETYIPSFPSVTLDSLLKRRLQFSIYQWSHLFTVFAGA